MQEKPTVRASAYGLATHDQTILLTRLSAYSPVFAPGLWHLPGGGIDPGEQPIAALTREIKEEAGLDVRRARLLDARTYHAERSGVSWQLLALFYAVELDHQQPTVTEIDGSSDTAAWIPLATITGEKLTPVVVDAIRLLASA